MNCNVLWVIVSLTYSMLASHMHGNIEEFVRLANEGFYKAMNLIDSPWEPIRVFFIIQLIGILACVKLLHDPWWKSKAISVWRSSRHPMILLAWNSNRIFKYDHTRSVTTRFRYFGPHFCCSYLTIVCNETTTKIPKFTFECSSTSIWCSSPFSIFQV